MEAGRARYRDDRHQLPTLSLGLTSVRLIVNQIEAESARVATYAFESSRELVKYDPNIDEGHDYDDFPLDSSRGRVWARIAVNLGVGLSRCIPSVSFGNFGVIAVVIGLFAPKMISYLVVYPLCRLVFGTLYPAYASYKAVRTKNLKEYVKWMMYWIVFALFTCTETFTDVFLSWFPFYYEVKIVLVLWLLSPATKGSSILYRKFVHPALCRREQEIDEYIAKAKDQGYHTVLNLGTKGVNYATTVIMQTAIKGGGGLVQQIRKSYSLSDLTECEPREERGADEADDVLAEPRLIRRGGKSPGYGTRRSASESNSRSPMYFPEVDVDVRTARSRTEEPDFSHIKSSEDISSGYSSADNSSSLTRAASLGAAARARARTSRTTVTTIKRPQAAEESEVIIEELHDDDSFEFANMPPLVNLPSPAPIFMSRTDPPFLYQYVGNQIRILQVLGNDPPNFKPNKETNDNTDNRDQTETAKQEDLQKNILEEEKFQESDVKPSQTNILEQDNPITTKYSDTDEKNDNNNNNNEPSVLNQDPSCSPDVDINEKETTVSSQEPSCSPNVEINEKDSKSKTDNLETEDIVTAQKTANETTANDHLDATSLDTSIYDNDSVESDDEASFGTPEGSPRAKRKSPKGKYGKGKAPSPPNPEIPKDNLIDHSNTLNSTVCFTSSESLNDIVNTMPNTTLKETGGSKTGLQVVNPIVEIKRRHKSKSPNRIHKSHTSGISKLLQLPNKLAFWNKSDDKSKSDQSQRLRSTSFGEDSTRSSTIEKEAEDFQSCFELSVDTATGNDLPSVDISDDLNSFKDACDIENEMLSHNIIEKSDALQKLIDAKIESHPEYKFVSLHDEIPTTSKSTDV